MDCGVEIIEGGDCEFTCTRVKKELDRQVLADVSSGSLGLSLVKSISMRANVKGSLLGCFEEGGDRVAAPLSAAFTCMLSMNHGWPCKVCQV